MAIRFPGTCQEWGEYAETFGAPQSNYGPAAIFSPNTAVAFGKSGITLVAPSRYSEVRKVAFWASIRHEHTGTQPVDEFKLHIAPFRTSDGGPIDFATIAESSVTELGSLFSKLGTARADEYPDSSEFNTEVPAQISSNGKNGISCLLYVEFERFAPDAGSVQFFQEWDSIAASGDDDRYVGYMPHVSRIDRGDGGTFTPGTAANTQPPVLANFGMAVIQTGSQSNDLCTYLSTGRPFIESQDDLTGSFATNTLEGGFFQYNPAEWDGITKVNLLAIQPTRDINNNNGQCGFRVDEVIAQTSGPNNIISPENQLGVSTSTGDNTFVYRTKDILADLQAGANHAVNVRTLGTGNTDRPMIQWEITQKAATKTLTRFIPVGTQFDGNQITPPEFGRSSTLFNPLWFEDLTEEQILSNLIELSFFHGSATNDPSTALYINADLGVNPPDDAFNQQLNPNLTDTPSATPGYKLLRSAISGVDPVNLAGRRQVIVRYEGTIWTSGTRVRPGWGMLEYVLDLPSSESVGVGPVFELDAFNPEGCASTAAGLGDNPGVLAITNGSVPPKKFNPVDQTISELGIQTPFRGEEPATASFDTAASPLGGLAPGVYTYRYTFRNSCTKAESDPNPVDIVVDASGRSPAARIELSFAGVRIPNDPQIDQICIYRTLEGGDFPVMAKVGCFDVDVATPFEDTTPDSELDFTNEGLSILNGFAPCAPVVAEFRNKLFLLGDIPELSPDGTVDVTQGSDEFEFSEDAVIDRCLVGRFIQVEGDCDRYEVAEILPPVSVSPERFRVKLTQEYEGTTRATNRFIVCGRPNRLYESEPLLPDSWPAANFLDIEPGDGDRLIGAISNFNSLVICKRNKTYALRFSASAAQEVIVPARISSDIGCVAPRSFAQIENGSVWLAERGLALYDGRGVRHVDESSLVNELLIDPTNPRYVRRDRNGRVIGAVGVFYPSKEQYLLLLPTVQTTRGANLMLVWDYHLRNITFLEFCNEFTSMEVAKDADGNQVVYLGDVNGFVWIFDIGDNDGVGVPNATGTVRGTVSSAGTDASGASFLEDTSATFLTGGIPGAANLSGTPGLSGFTGSEGMGLAGVCLFTRSRNAGLDDPWVRRTIFASTPNRLYISPGWGNDEPSVGDDYMLGAIEMVAEFKPRNYDTDDLQKRDWQQILTHEPEDKASKVRVELIPDFQNSDPEELTVIDQNDEVGNGRTFLMDFSLGRQIAPVGRLVHNYQQVRFKNFAPDEPVRILQHVLRITPKVSR